LYRKKAKTSKSSATELVSDKSSDKSDKPESDNRGTEYETGLSMTQHQPLLLSQSGKFIPKFLAKKKAGECTVKLERAAAKFTESDSCGHLLSETDVYLKSPVTDNISDADELLADGRSACRDSVMPAEDACDEPALVTVSSAASDSEHFTLANNDWATSTGPVTQGLQAAGTDLEPEEMTVGDNGNECDSCEDAEPEETLNRNEQSDYVAGELETSPDNDHGCDVTAATKTTSSAANDSVDAPHSEAVATAVSHDGCMQSQAAGGQIGQCRVDTKLVIDDGSQAGRDDTNSDALRPDVNVEDDLGRMSSEAVVDAAVLDDVEPGSDAVSNDDGGGKAAGITDATVDDLVGDDSCKTVALAAVTVNMASDEDADAETGNDVTVTSDKQSVSTSSEALLFDDVLDLTDSQLCQLDYMSRSALAPSVRLPCPLQDFSQVFS